MAIDPSDPDVFAKILASLPDVKMGIGMTAAAMCLVTWEYICTMPLAFRFLLSNRNWVSKVLFLLNRYSGVCSLICLTMLASGKATAKNCDVLAWTVISTWGILSLVCIFVLLRRTWCISNRDNMVLYILTPFALFMTASSLSVVAETSPYWVEEHGMCLQAASQSVNPLRLRIMISSSALYDFIVMAVTVFKLRQLIKHTGTATPFVAMLESHSILYYVVIAVMDMTTFGVSFFVPTFISTIAPFLPGTITVAVQRIMLEDVDFSTKNRLHQVRGFIERNMGTMGKIPLFHRTADHTPTSASNRETESVNLPKPIGSTFWPTSPRTSRFGLQRRMGMNEGGVHISAPQMHQLTSRWRAASRADKKSRKASLGIEKPNGKKSQVYIQEEREIQICNVLPLEQEHSYSGGSLPKHTKYQSTDLPTLSATPSSTSSESPESEKVGPDFLAQ